MKAKIYISYKEGILDPQGQTVNHALDSIGIKKIHSVRMGKYIEMEFNGISKDKAGEIADESCRKLLANPNTETYSFEIVEE
ncbi:MAG: phosphoribosylformylglycinamidine synthase subunit PurS [Candidatus Marinimicrobia bacterium]|jgi:phosphoribosylformylglycinamidine synthase|nr:phosphoribosylformylglycinamidine synthase subunit PurS [Candidatus Neomarinimicrobiota bacterium]MDP6853374.1 phosphoribosylformylglycinamidine synthase subunit PurS [Candidatus Neomarinimicrobiota bacterium]MDP6936767.1 phosphoribosylformylglycinamidine synthase subunit PurS [Candidatus Neomarinimicrobiota bacterium]